MFGSKLLVFLSLLLPVFAVPLENVERSLHVSTTLGFRDGSSIDVTAPNVLKRKETIDAVVLGHTKTEMTDIKREPRLPTNEEDAGSYDETIKEEELMGHIEGRRGVRPGRNIGGNKRGVRPGNNVGGNKRGVRPGNNIGGNKRGVRPGGNIGDGKRGVRPGGNIGGH